MAIEAFVRGVVVGLAIAAPVGPIGVLVIRRSLRDGRVLGLATGLGAAAADGVFALIGALGVGALAPISDAIAWPLRLAGVAILVVLALRMLRPRPPALDGDEVPRAS